MKTSFRKLQRFSVYLAIAALMLVCFVPADAQETTKPATDTTASSAKNQKSPEAPISGTIRGQLVASDGQPFTNANVLVQSMTGTPAAKPARADADGQFVFEDLAPGSYLIIGTAPGYVDESISAGDYMQWPRHLIGSTVKVNMIRGGVITGKVINARGEPVVGVPVRTTLVSRTPSSALGFLTGGNFAETDDRGIYRVYGLLPGQYVVDAGGSGRFGQFSASGFDGDVTTYYPSGTRDTAVPVTVRSGEEAANIDIKYRGGDGHAISGVITGEIPASANPGAITVFLSQSATSAMLSLKIVIPSEPRRVFSFNGVADGEYDVFASYLVDPKQNALMAAQHVIVRNGDVTGVELHLASLASLAGTIALDPIKPEDKCDKRNSQLIETFLSVPADEVRKNSNNAMLVMLGGGLSTLSEKGEFALHNLEAGKYRLDIRLPSDSWYIRAINLPARAATQPAAAGAPRPPATAAPAGWQGTIALRAGEQINGATIFVGQDAAGLRGKLLTEGAIREGTTVHLVPVEREQANNVLRYSETLVKSDGTFVLKNVAPGRYFVLARVEAAVESEKFRRPVSWDETTRTKLRQQAETANIIVELKPCQKMIDYELK
ncbi:MAG TPA: carboxypeptidase-like regulatory domain-containing protein [Pyrinomonadaceae bacterium]|nr:carboxypeptidase-like regulatory domain-containing protein [Pyrinomonadaceae bacterium]